MAGPPFAEPLSPRGWTKADVDIDDQVPYAQPFWVHPKWWLELFDLVDDVHRERAARHGFYAPKRACGLTPKPAWKSTATRITYATSPRRMRICAGEVRWILLPRPHVANLAGAVLGLLPGDERVELAADVDAEGRLEEEEHQAEEADDPGDRAVGVEHVHQDEHHRGQRHADDPRELLLACPDVLGHLVADDEPPQDQRRGVPRAHEDTDEHVGQEDGDGVLQEDEASLEDGRRDGREHEDEEDPGRRPDLPLVQHGDAVALDVLTELPDAAHDPLPLGLRLVSAGYLGSCLRDTRTGVAGVLATDRR